MNELKIFQNTEFGNVRTIEENGKVIFCGKDVAKALGYDQPLKAIKRHCKDPRGTFYTLGVRTGTKKDGTPAIQNTRVKFIDEGNVYRLKVGERV